MRLKLYTQLFALLALCHSALAEDSFQDQLVTAAIARTLVDIRYDDSYFYIPYPNGDVPEGIGVCTDVVVRTYRALGIDLQQLVHEDISENFSLYPSKRIWDLDKADPNIDHRRVPNLEVFFRRYGEELPITQDPADYRPGDIVTWRMRKNAPHIGIITDLDSPSDGTPLIVHNVGKGPQLDSILFRYKIAGHFRFVPPSYKHLDELSKTEAAEGEEQLFKKTANGVVLNEELLKKMFPEETKSRF